MNFVDFSIGMCSHVIHPKQLIYMSFVHYFLVHYVSQGHLILPCSSMLDVLRVKYLMS